QDYRGIHRHHPAGAAGIVPASRKSRDPPDLADHFDVSAGLLFHSGGCPLYLSARLDLPDARSARGNARGAKTHAKPDAGPSIVVVRTTRLRARDLHHPPAE